MTRDIVYNYIDGNGNKFIIKNDTIEYIPIKPAFSSSGRYDGGEYTKKYITSVQYNKILSAIHNGLRDKENHIKDRVKGSGMIIRVKYLNKEIFILKSHSKGIIKIENLLNELLYH